MSYQFPKTQIAAVVPGPKQPVVIQRDVPVTQPFELKPGQCLLKMICTGVCHTDLHVSKADWPVKAATPFIGGHEGVGEVVAIADHTEESPVKLGQRVGIKWIAYCCRDCDQCRQGFEQNCANVQLSGLTVDGTFSQYVVRTKSPADVVCHCFIIVLQVSWVHTVTPIPDSLDSFAAASLLCAGVTVYRALKYSEARIGNWVVVPGAGGGLGHLAVQYAVAMGMRVVAIGSLCPPLYGSFPILTIILTDTGAEKQKLCSELGAEKWIDFRETTDIVKAVKEACDGLGAHTAIVTSPYSEGYTQAVDYLRPAATLMAVGLPADAKFEASIFWTVLKSISIKGSYVGNRQDSIEAIDIAASGKVKVKYISKSLTDLQQVYNDLEEGKVAGRIVLDSSK
ncbi:chaperonin 10-like protein [Lanmaoa asiatica]|nr:chaperonin 10-like protein [Lanmaoa asiatica]